MINTFLSRPRFNSTSMVASSAAIFFKKQKANVFVKPTDFTLSFSLKAKCSFGQPTLRCFRFLPFHFLQNSGKFWLGDGDSDWIPPKTNRKPSSPRIRPQLPLPRPVHRPLQDQVPKSKDQSRRDGFGAVIVYDPDDRDPHVVDDFEIDFTI